MSKHTAGPWRYKEWGGLIVGGGTGSDEILICTMAVNTRHDEGRCNRELILAAPTMQAALTAERERADRAARDCNGLSLDVQTLKAERDALRERLRELVDGLERTHWSSWQTTAHFWKQFEAARAISEDRAMDDIAEEAYWEFDARHKGYGPFHETPQSERDAFKIVFYSWCLGCVPDADINSLTIEELRTGIAIQRCAYERLRAELTAERERADRAEAALRELGKHPEECADDGGACVSHLAYEDCTAERDALRERVARLVGVIEAAPHEKGCGAFWSADVCSCWKRTALGDE